MKNTVIAVLIMFVVALGICVVYPKKPVAPTPVTPTVATETTVVNEAAVVTAVRAKALLSGLEGTLHKTYGVNDTIKGYYVDGLTQRSFTVDFDARWLIGIDCEKVKVMTKGTTVVIVLPEPQLIALEPKNQVFTGTTGLLRKALTDNDKQFIVNAAVEAVKAEVMSVSNREQAMVGVKDALRNIVGAVPGVGSVEFL